MKPTQDPISAADTSVVSLNTISPSASTVMAMVVESSVTFATIFVHREDDNEIGFAFDMNSVVLFVASYRITRTLDAATSNSTARKRDPSAAAPTTNPTLPSTVHGRIQAETTYGAFSAMGDDALADRTRESVDAEMSVAPW
jgi:hypothetical protein